VTEITDIQSDVLRELMNIGVGKGAAILNTMLSRHIKLQIPEIRIITPESFYREFAEQHDRMSGGLSAVNLGFRGAFSGNANLLFPVTSAIKLVTAVTGEEPDPSDLDSIQAGTLTEVGNIVLNAVMGTLSNILHSDLHYTVPVYSEGKIEELFVPDEFGDETVIQLAKVRFLIEELDVEGDIVLFFEIGSFNMLLEKLDTMAE